MDYSHFAIALLLLSVTVVFAEIFIPSGGMLSLIAIATVASSIVCAWYAWWELNPTAFWAFLVLSFVAFPSAVAGALYIFPMTPIGKIALLEPQPLSDVDADTAYDERLRSLVGRRGRTAGLLTPGGVVVVDGERWNCESEGMLIEAGAEVEVVGVKGRSLVVREWTERSDVADFEERPVDGDDAESGSQVDFEMT